MWFFFITIIASEEEGSGFDPKMGQSEFFLCACSLCEFTPSGFLLQPKNMQVVTFIQFSSSGSVDDVIISLCPLGNGFCRDNSINKV